VRSKNSNVLREEGITKPCDPDWKDYDGLVHATSASLDRSVFMLRTLKGYDLTMIALAFYYPYA